MDNTIKIVRVQVDELDPGPLDVPFMDATMGPFHHWKINWLRLTASDGTVGQAMGTAGLPESVSALLNDGPREIDDWSDRLFWLHRNNGHRSPASSGPLAAIDLAMRDILARRAGLPLHRYLGATRDSVPVYGSGGGTNQPLDKLVAEMRGLADRGFKTLKMKVGMDFGRRMDEDVQRVFAVRQAIGPDIGLAVDANQTWSAREALRFAERIAQQGISWFEEPVHSADRQAIREIAKHCPFPVAMGESENHWLGFRDLAECGVQHPQPSPSALPGFARWKQAVGFGRATGGQWSGGGSPHLNAWYIATEPDGMQEFLHGIVGQWARVWSVCPQISDGQVTLGSTPGLGIKVDWEGLRTKSGMRQVIDAGGV
jgi:L-alanine-DL-glutamate epimerase-like enolase superfamily enzyme